MAQTLISEMQKLCTYEGFLRVKLAQQKTGSNGAKYIDMTLSDVSGEINAKVWDGVTPVPEAGSIVNVRVTMQEFNGRPQLRVDRMRRALPSDHCDMSVIIPCAPRPAEDMLDEIAQTVAAFQNEEIKNVVLERLDEVNDRLLYYPAAQRIHHAERAGLLHHTTSMLEAAKALVKVYDFLNSDLLFAGVILHDLAKTEELSSDTYGMVSEYTRSGQMLGHLVQGAIAIDRAARAVGASDETRDMLCHMILSHHDIPEYGSPKPPMFPEAEMLALIDRMDARMFEMKAVLAGTEPGTFTDRINSLDGRRLYRKQAEK